MKFQVKTNLKLILFGKTNIFIHQEITVKDVELKYDIKMNSKFIELHAVEEKYSKQQQNLKFQAKNELKSILLKKTNIFINKKEMYS